MSAERSEQGNHEVPLRQQRQAGQSAGLPLIERLEQRTSPRAVVDAWPAKKPLSAAASIEASVPCEVARRVVLLRPLPLEKRLRPAVATLLAPVGAQRAPPVVPDHRRGAEAELPPQLAQPPADVDVVACHAELRIEATDGREIGRASCRERV